MKNRKLLLLKLFFFFLTGMLVLTGCSHIVMFNGAVRVNSYEEAGAVNLSVPMVVPLEKYITTLQPKFDLTAEQALGKVIPSTSYAEQSISDALAFKLMAGFNKTSAATAPTGTSTGTTTGTATGTSTGTATGTTAGTSTGTTTGTATGTTTGTSTGTTAGDSGSDYQRPDDTAIPGLSPRIAGSNDESVLKYSGLSKEPMLEYLAATSLYQEVKLLSGYVEEAALKYGYTPYVVRIQLGVIPYARNEPYDVYTTMSFFPFIGYDDVKEEYKKSMRSISDKTKCIEKCSKFADAVKNERVMSSQNIADVMSDINAGFFQTDYNITSLYNKIMFDNTDDPDQCTNFCYKSEALWQKAIVLPLLVTDNIEGTLRSQSMERIRQLSFALGLLTNSIDAEAGFNKLNNQFKKIIGSDLNSLMTVSRISDNSIQARLGAPVHPTADYAMIPRTHYITTLVMVPSAMFKEGFINQHIRLVSKSTFRDSKDGKMLKSQPRYKENEKIISMLESYDPFIKLEFESGRNENEILKIEDPNKNKLIKDGIKQLFYALYDNDYPRFKAYLAGLFCREISSRHREIWLNFNEIIMTDQFASISFDIPKPPELKFLDENQSVFMMDDGENTMKCVLLGGKNLKKQKLGAVMHLAVKKQVKEKPADPNASAVSDKEMFMIPLKAITIETDAEGGNPVITFPSPAAWKIKDIEQYGPILKNSVLEVSYDGNNQWELNLKKPMVKNFKSIMYQVKKPPEEEPGFKMWTSLTYVTQKTGNLHLFVEMKESVPEAKKVELILTGADVADILPKENAVKNMGKIIINKSGEYTIALENLNDTAKIVINGTAKKVDNKSIGGEHKPLTLDIIKDKSGS